ARHAAGTGDQGDRVGVVTRVRALDGRNSRGRRGQPDHVILGGEVGGDLCLIDRGNAREVVQVHASHPQGCITGVVREDQEVVPHGQDTRVVPTRSDVGRRKQDGARLLVTSCRTEVGGAALLFLPYEQDHTAQLRAIAARLLRGVDEDTALGQLGGQVG